MLGIDTMSMINFSIEDAAHMFLLQMRLCCMTEKPSVDICSALNMELLAYYIQWVQKHVVIRLLKCLVDLNFLLHHEMIILNIDQVCRFLLSYLW